MNSQIRYIQNSIIVTISALFEGNFSQICEVKKAVLHLEAIYFCHSTCLLIGYEELPIEKQLELYENLGLIPPSTVAFFEKNSAVVLKNWPTGAEPMNRPELLYDALLASELCIRPSGIWFSTGKISRDMAGAYYTSSDFSNLITRRAIDTYLEEAIGISSYSFSNANMRQFSIKDALAPISFLDYSCGCGEFLLAIIQYFENYIADYPIEDLVLQLYGIDVNPIAVMIAMARVVSRIKEPVSYDLLQRIARNYTAGNPLIHADNSASLDIRFNNFALGRLYSQTEGMSVSKLVPGRRIVLGNPPWEKLRFEERSFFKPLCPEISAISQKNKRAEAIAGIDVTWPELFDYYKLLQSDYTAIKRIIPNHPLLKRSLVGELNTYALFADLASQLTENKGFAAIIVKSALVTSTCYAELFQYLVGQGHLHEIFLYENRQRIFPIDGRERFCVMFMSTAKTNTIKVHYGLTCLQEMIDSRPISVTLKDMTLINPETRLLPNVSSAAEFAFLLRAHKSLPVFAEEFPQIHFGRLVHLTAHAEKITMEQTEENAPIYEGKFLEQYDNRFATFDGVESHKCYQAKASARRQPGDAFLVQKPFPKSRYFVEKTFWDTFLVRYNQPFSLCWRSLTSPTNQRTMIATVLPTMPTCQSIQLLQTPSKEELLLLLALFNSKVFDYFVRLKMAGIDLTQSIVRQIPVPHRQAWDRCVSVNGADCRAIDAVMGLQKLLYKHEPNLAPLFDGVPDVGDRNRYKSSREVCGEIDKIITTLYGLTKAEEEMILHAFAE